MIAFLLSSFGPVEAIYNELLLKEIRIENPDYNECYETSFDIDQWGQYR